MDSALATASTLELRPCITIRDDLASPEHRA